MGVYGNQPLMQQAQFLPTYQGAPIQELKEGTEQLRQEYYQNIANMDKIELAMNQLDLLPGDQAEKDRMVELVKSTIDQIKEEGDRYETAFPRIRELSRAVSGDARLLEAERRSAEYKQAKQVLDEKLAKNVISPEQYEDYIRQMDSYQGLGPSNDPKEWNQFNVPVAVPRVDMDAFDRSFASTLESNKYTSGWKPVTENIGGQEVVVFYDQSTGERITPEEVKRAYLQTLKSNPDTRAYFEDIARIRGVELDEILEPLAEAAGERFAFERPNATRRMANPLLRASRGSGGSGSDQDILSGINPSITQPGTEYEEDDAKSIKSEIRKTDQLITQIEDQIEQARADGDEDAQNRLLEQHKVALAQRKQFEEIDKESDAYAARKLGFDDPEEAKAQYLEEARQMYEEDLADMATPIMGPFAGAQSLNPIPISATMRLLSNIDAVASEKVRGALNTTLEALTSAGVSIPGGMPTLPNLLKVDPEPSVSPAEAYLRYTDYGKAKDEYIRDLAAARVSDARLLQPNDKTRSHIEKVFNPLITTNPDDIPISLQIVDKEGTRDIKPEDVEGLTKVKFAGFQTSDPDPNTIAFRFSAELDKDGETERVSLLHRATKEDTSSLLYQLPPMERKRIMTEKNVRNQVESRTRSGDILIRYEEDGPQGKPIGRIKVSRVHGLEDTPGAFRASHYKNGVIDATIDKDFDEIEQLIRYVMYMDLQTQEQERQRRINTAKNQETSK